MSKTSPIQVVYINSTAFSGSTLLTRLLLSHPQVASVGELAGFVAKTSRQKERNCSCGNIMTNCPFWSKLAEELKGRNLFFDPNWFGTKFRLLPYKYRVLNALSTGYLGCNAIEKLRLKVCSGLATYRKRIENIVFINESFIESVCRITGASVFVDSSKYSSRAKFLNLSNKLDIKVIQLTRDSKGVVYSFGKNSRLSIIHGALRYNFSHMKASALKRWMPPDKHLRIRYEDICSDPVGTVNRIFEFVELGVLQELDLERSESIHIIGNRMRHLKELKITHDSSWKKNLSPAQVLVISFITYPYLKRYGYLAPKSQNTSL